MGSCVFGTGDENIMAEDLLFERVTNIESPTGFFFDHIHEITGGLWGPSMTLIVFAVTFLGLNGDTRKSFAAASFTAMVVTVMLIPFGLMNSQGLLLVGMLVVLSIALNTGNGGRI